MPSKAPLRSEPPPPPLRGEVLCQSPAPEDTLLTSSPTPPRAAPTRNTRCVDVHKANATSATAGTPLVAASTNAPPADVTRCQDGANHKGDFERAVELREMEVRLSQLDGERRFNNSVSETEFHAVWRCLARVIDRQSIFERANAAAAVARTLQTPQPSPVNDDGRATRQSASMNGSWSNNAPAVSSSANASTTAADTAPSANSSILGSTQFIEDQLEPIRGEQRRLRSRVSDLSSAIDELRTQSGAALVNHAKIRDNRERDIAIVLNGLQEQINRLGEGSLEFTKELMKLSATAVRGATCSSSPHLERSLQRVEQVVAAILGFGTQDGEHPLDDNVSVDAILQEVQADAAARSASSDGNTMELTSVRSRLLAIRARLSANRMPPPATLAETPPLPNFDSPDTPFGASGTFLEVMGPSAQSTRVLPPSEVEASKPSLRAQPPDGQSTSATAEVVREEAHSLEGNSAPKEVEVVHQASPGDSSQTDVALLRRQQAELRALLEQGKMELWSVQAHWEAELANQREMVGSEAAALAHAHAQLRSSLLQEVEVALHSQTIAAQQFQAECQKELVSELQSALDQIQKATSSAASRHRVDSRCELHKL